MKPLIRRIFKVFLVIFSPFTFLSALWLKLVMKQKGKTDDKIFSSLGILPVLDHYYEPLTNPRKHLKKVDRSDRVVPAVDLNAEEQLNILSRFHYAEELLRFPSAKPVGGGERAYFYNNNNYGPGDAEYLYNMIRLYRPGKIVEIGSGYSTLMARNACSANKIDNPKYECEHICVEPFEMPWLASQQVTLIRKKVEDLDLSFFEQLGEHDILFIDSSHVIRPQGDVLWEYLEILPALKPGVIVHIHDIFTPRDYPESWMLQPRLWNEQYLLEAFLSFNDKFKVIGAVNFLYYQHHEALAKKCPVIAQLQDKDPGGFWIQKV